MLKFTSQLLSTPVAMTSHIESGTEGLQTQAECKYKFVHIYILNW